MANDILVVLFLRGGCDGLNLVGPSADINYHTERRNDIRVERDGDIVGLPLHNTLADVDFRFHFKAKDLKELYDAKHLAIIHACGLNNGTRSHFEAQDYIERGTPENKNTSTGWLTRLAAQQRISGSASIISVGNSLPVSLLACTDAMAVPNVRKMQMQGDGHYKPLKEALLKKAYQGNSLVAGNGRRVLEVLDEFAHRIPTDGHGKQVDYTPDAKAVYLDGEFPNSLKTLAQIIKMDIGMRVATIDYGGWDTHVGQNGQFPNQVDRLSRSLAAFWNDIAAIQDRVTIVVMSEFGRRLKGNESGGTDHGHGNAMIVLGGHIRGGEIYGRWPGLATEQLDNQVDLAITTDYRSVLGEIITKRFGVANLGIVFPDFADFKPLGIVA